MEHWSHIIGNSLCSYALLNSWTALLKSLCAKHSQNPFFFFFCLTWPIYVWITIYPRALETEKARMGLYHHRSMSFPCIVQGTKTHEADTMPYCVLRCRMCKVSLSYVSYERTVDSSQLWYFCSTLKYLADSNPKWKVNDSPAKIAISCYFENNILKMNISQYCEIWTFQFTYRSAYFGYSLVHTSTWICVDLHLDR